MTLLLGIRSTASHGAEWYPLPAVLERLRFEERGCEVTRGFLQGITVDCLGVTLKMYQYRTGHVVRIARTAGFAEKFFTDAVSVF